MTLADEHRKSVPYAGPIKVSFNNRYYYLGALVLRDEVLSGTVPMENMDLLLSLAKRLWSVFSKSKVIMVQAKRHYSVFVLRNPR